MARDLTPESIQRTARNFTEARLLLTGVELDLFTMLAAGSLSASEITARLGSDLRATSILLDALTALGYLAKDKDLYRTEPSVTAFLCNGTPESILPGLRHTAHLWSTWSQLTDVVLEGGPARVVKVNREDYVRAFIGAMHVRALRDASDLVESVSPGEARALLDVGGGAGSYAIAFLEAVPAMRATVFDLPEVIEMAREYVSEAGLLGRVQLVAGDYREDALPPGHDLALLSAIIHQNSHGQNLALYRKVFDALDPGGRIVIRDYVMSPDRTEPASGAVFAVNMLVNTEGGNSYTFDEIRDGLTEAGFERVRSAPDREMSTLVEAYRP